MARMAEDDLLKLLQNYEEDAAGFVTSTLGNERETAWREYFREPYGTEDPGWSNIVTSDVQDTVEWMLPDLLDIFTSTDEAVVFEPQQAKDVQGAQQATNAVNYVFYRQNNGFVTLYTAFKDALLSKNCAVMWRKETQRVKTIVPIKMATPEMLAMALQQAGEDAEIESAEPVTPQDLPKQPPPQAAPQMPPQGGPPGMPPQGGPPGMPPQGPNGARGFASNMMPGGIQPVGGVPPQQPMPQMPPPTPEQVLASLPPMFNARIAKYEEKTTVRVETFSPDDLLVQRDWHTPLLDDCPYVARNMGCTLSEVHQMGFTDVTAEDLAASDDATLLPDAQFRDNRRGTDTFGSADTQSDDETQTRGWLRLEYVLVDFDGDGIAERREVIRLADRILSNEEAQQVPIATATPCIIPHRWDGLSIAEMVSDIQQVKTELTRQMLNNAYLANNPRKKVLTTADWAPLANIDDLLDGRPGGVLRQRDVNAITIDQTPWIGGNMFPMLQYIDQMREQRTGVSKQQQGLDPNTLRPDRTATEIQMTATAARQRIRLIARILGETLLKPVFAGILKLLTDGDMKHIAFRLDGQFVDYDPNEWRDHYDMTINVGLGTGDRQQQAALLQQMLMNQMQIAQTPFGQLLITPQQIFNTEQKITENAGYKDVATFWTNPQGRPLQPPPQQPAPQVQAAQIRAQTDQAIEQLKGQQQMALANLRAQNEGRLATMQAQFNAKLEMMRVSGQTENAKANLALQATNDQRDGEREVMNARFEHMAEEANRSLDWSMAQLDANTRLAIAAIQAEARKTSSPHAPNGSDA